MRNEGDLPFFKWNDILFEASQSPSLNEMEIRINILELMDENNSRHGFNWSNALQIELPDITLENYTNFIKNNCTNQARCVF